MTSAKMDSTILMDKEHEDSISRTLASFQEQDRLRVALNASASSVHRARASQVAEEEKDVTARFMSLAIDSISEDEDSAYMDAPDETVDQAVVLPDDHAFKALPIGRSHSCLGFICRLDLTFTIENCEKIMLYVGEDYFPVCSRVSKSFATILSSETLWKALCLSVYVKPAYMPTRMTSTGRPLRAASWTALALSTPIPPPTARTVPL